MLRNLKKKKPKNKEHTITMAGPVYFNLFATETLFKLENIRFSGFLFLIFL